MIYIHIKGLVLYISVMTSTKKVNIIDDSLKTSYETLSSDKIECVSFMAKNKGESRKVSLLKYCGQELIMESPEIKTSHYGIPSYHEKYAPSDDKREYVKIPLNPKQSDDVNTFISALNKLDDYLSSDAVKLKILGEKKVSKYTYCPIVRSPHIDEDEENEEKIAKAKANPNYCKMNFYRPYNSKSKKIKTRFIELIPQEGSEIKTMKRIKFDTIDELLDDVRYQALNKYVFSFGSIWIQAGLKTYGVTIKLLELYTVKPLLGSGSVVSHLMDSDSDDDQDNREGSSDSEEQPQNTQNTKTQQVFTNEDDVNENSESNSDSNSDSESESEVEETPKPIVRKTRGRKKNLSKNT